MSSKLLPLWKVLFLLIANPVNPVERFFSVQLSFSFSWYFFSCTSYQNVRMKYG